MKTANNKLKKRRIACGFTQSELADASGINVRSLSCYEQNISKFVKANVATVIKLADCLGCSVEDLVDRNYLQ